LLDMILCLAERVDECCSTPTDTPVLAASQVQILNQNGTTVPLTDPTQALTVSQKTRPFGIEVTFAGLQVDKTSITSTSFTVGHNGNAINGTCLLNVGPNTVRWFAPGGADALFQQGEHKVTLLGKSPDSIKAQNGDELDGEPNQNF